MWQPGDLRQRVLEAPHQLERALGVVWVLERMKLRMARQRRDALVELGVVLHRARPERVEAGVKVEVALRQTVVVADDLGFGDLRQPRRLAAPHRGGQQLVERALRDVELWRDERPASGLRALIDRQLVVGGGDEGRGAHAFTSS